MKRLTQPEHRHGVSRSHDVHWAEVDSGQPTQETLTGNKVKVSGTCYKSAAAASSSAGTTSVPWSSSTPKGAEKQTRKTVHIRSRDRHPVNPSKRMSFDFCDCCGMIWLIAGLPVFTVGK